MSRKIKPNYIEEGELKVDVKKAMPAKMYKLIENVLSEFEYSINEIVDISRYIIISDVDTALNDSVPMMTWFDMYGNKAKEREEYFTENLKRMEADALVRGKSDKVSRNKADIINNKMYIKVQSAIRKYRKIRRDCEALSKAMSMRKDIAQTRSANARRELGGYNFNK